MGVIELITDLEQQDIRLWLEDGQLRFSAPKGGMSEATRLRLKEHKQAIIEFLAQSQKPAGTALAQTDRNLPQVLSCAQERIWFLSQLEPDNIAFHLPVIFSMQGALDIGILEQVLNTLLARHSILRTAYLQTATTTCQQIRAEKTIALNMRHYTHLLDTAQINAIAEQELRRPFNLGEGDVCHHLLVLMPEQQHLLFLTIHHIATDAWSMAIIGNEIAQLYSAFAHRQANPLPPLPVQYADFAVWQRSNLGSIGIQQQLEFWRNTLAGHENLGFPGDFARPAIADNHGASIKFMLGHDTTAALHGLAKQHNTTLFVVLLSLFGSLLYRYSRQQQFCIGTPVAGRSHSQCESLAGCFLNLLALPATYSADTSFAELLEQNRRTTLAAFANQDVPFEEVVRATVNTRNLSVTPLFQVLFSLQNTPFERITRIENIAISTIEPEQLASLYDLSINAKEWAGEIYAELDYKTALFSRQTMQALLDNFYRLIDSVIANPLQLLDSIGFIGAHDQQRQLLEWNNTARRRDSHLTIHALVERQAQQQATASAVHFCGQTLSYGELNSQANQLARHLQQSGIAAGSLVGVLLERSLALPVALLAIIKAGGCYLPLDPAYPQAHLDNIVRDARLEWLLTDDNTVAWQIPQALHTINLAQRKHWQMLASTNLPAPTAEKPLFNVIYTSGSSGKPKGVAVSHAALVNRLLWMQETFPLQNHDRVLHKTTYCFDVSVWEIFWPLASGAQLVIAEPDGQRDAAYLHELISGQGISVAHFVPSMLDVFLATGIAGQQASLKYLFCSGETLSLPQAKSCQALYPHCTLVNLYGPTEAAIDVSYHICKPNEITVPIGKPISNTQIYIVDENLQLLPTGAIGELAIAGSGLAEGYLHQPGLTASVFVDNPFTPGTRLYKSGDLARLDHDGRLHFLGRNDQQVKVRGFRVEPGDIENCLHRHPAIERALVHARSQGNSHSITAYFRSRAAVTVQELREHLLQSLPAFMMPDAFVELHAWPLAANGKIDRKALPEPDRGSAAQQPYMAPRNATEQAIADIWAELLKRPEIGIHDNFFELGGHSLLATMAISRLQNEFNVKIPLNQIFQLPTIANFALAIDRAQQNPGSAADNHTPERGQQEGSLE